ncbi:MAG: HEPN domain-containing protein, partial [Chloroflexia bacterium]
MEEVSLSGRWYVPSEPDTQINGTLSFSVKDGVKLELSGKFGLAVLGLRDQSFDIINGITDRGKWVTLTNCDLYSSTIATGAGAGSTMYRARFAFVGAAFPSLDDIKFKEVWVRFTYLDQWISVQAIQVALGDDHAVTINYKRPDPISIGTLAKGNVSIQFTYSTPLGNKYDTATIKQEAHICIEFHEDQSWNDIIALSGRIRNFLSLAVWEPAYPVECTGFHPSVVLHITKDKTEQAPIDIYYQPSGQIFEEKRLSPHDMFFMLGDVLDEMPTLLGNFVQTEGILKPAYDLYFATMYSPQSFVEPRFLSLVQAVEVFCRRTMSNEELPQDEHDARMKVNLTAVPDDYNEWLGERLKFSNEPTLKVRLRRLLDDTDLLPITSTFIPKVSQFVRRTADTRNYYT